MSYKVDFELEFADGSTALRLKGPINPDDFSPQGDYIASIKVSSLVGLELDEVKQLRDALDNIIKITECKRKGK